jgi:uncharacterized protein (DUF3084 family)
MSEMITKPAPTDDAPGADNPTAETAATIPAKTFTQAELDAIIADRLKRQEEKLSKSAKQTAEAEAEKKLAEAAEYQKLAETRAERIAEHEKRIAELEQSQAQADKYGAALSTYVEKLSANVPPEITALLENMDAADRLSWLTSNAEKFAKATTEQPEAENGAAKRPLPSTPPPNSSAKMTPEERRKKSARTW